MKTFLLYLFLTSSWLVAQNSNSNEVAKIERRLLLAQSYFELPQDSLVAHAKFVINHAERPTDVALAHYYLGNTYKINNNLNAALNAYQQANSLFKKALQDDENNTELLNNYANTFASMGIVYSQQSNYSQAILYHFEARKRFLQTNNTEKLAAIHNNIGIEYQSLDKFDEAISYFNKALAYNKNNKISNVLLFTNCAKNYLRKNQFSTAKKYLDKALTHANDEKNSYNLGELYNNLAFYFYHNSEFEMQKKYLEMATTAFQGDAFGLSDTYYYYGLYHLKNKAEATAISYFEKAIENCKKLEIKELHATVLQQLIQIYEKKGAINTAFQLQKEYTDLQHELALHNSEKALSFVELQAKFDKNKEAFQELETAKKRQFYIYLCIIFGLFLGVVFLIYNNKQKMLQKNLIFEKQQAEFQHKALHLQMNPHFVFNCLGSISSFILQNENETALTYLSHFAKLMRITLENSKENKISIEKEMESLKQYLELEKLRYENVFTYQVSKSKSVDETIKMPPMLLQPLVENAIIHGVNPKGKNGVIQVYFDASEDTLICTITDNGVGYFKSQQQKKGSVLAHKSLALSIVQDRINLLGGTFEISERLENEEISGTTVQITLTIKE